MTKAVIQLMIIECFGWATLRNNNKSGIFPELRELTWGWDSVALIKIDSAKSHK